jgi:hypothetical protein
VVEADEATVPDAVRPVRARDRASARLEVTPAQVSSLTRPASFYPNQECQTSAETAIRGEALKPVYESVTGIHLKKYPLLQLANGRKEQFKI